MKRSTVHARAWTLSCLAALAVVTSSATAKGAPFELDWTAPRGCPSGEQIVTATRARLGESKTDSNTDSKPELFVHGSVEPARGGFVVTLALRDAAGTSVGERVLRVDRPACRDIEEPTSVVLAMMIAVAVPAGDGGSPDETRAEPAAPRSPPNSPDAGAEARQAPRPAAGSASESASAGSSPSPRDHASLGVVGTASTGLLPNVGLGVAIRGLYRTGSLVVFGLDAGFEDGGAIHAPGGKTGLQLFGVAARAGVAILRRGPVELIPTFVVRVGLMRTSPEGFVGVSEEARLTPFVGAGALVRARLTGSLYAELLPELEVDLVRDRFVAREGDNLFRVHRPSAIAGRLSLGLGWEFY